MDASSPRIMTLDHRVNIGGSHAFTQAYPQPPTRSTALPPSTCRPTCSSATTRRRPRPQSSGRCCWPPPCASPRSSDACESLRDAPSDEAARKPLIATLPDFAELQSQLNAPLAGDLPRLLCRRPHAPGRRPGPDPLSRPAAAATTGRPHCSAAKSGTSHFHAYATALCRPSRLSLHHRLDGRQGRRTAGGGPQAPAPPGPRPSLSALSCPARSRLLQRGGHPLSPGGAVSVPDAGDLSGPQSRDHRAAPAGATFSDLKKSGWGT